MVMPKRKTPFSKIRKPMTCVIALVLETRRKKPISTVANAAGMMRGGNGAVGREKAPRLAKAMTKMAPPPIRERWRLTIGSTSFRIFACFKERKRKMGMTTALIVMGPDKGFEFAENHGITAMFIIRHADVFTEKYTGAFEACLIDR